MVFPKALYVFGMFILFLTVHALMRHAHWGNFHPCLAKN